MKKLTAILAALMTAACMTAGTAMAADFTPSVTGKAAPETVTVTTESGEEAVAIIRDANGAEVQGLTADSLTVTSVANASTADAEVTAALTAAYAQIQEASSVADLVPDTDSVLEAAGSVFTSADLVVRDLFDVSIDDAARELLDAGNSIQIGFNLGISADDEVFCLHNYSGSEWELIDPSLVINNGDGTVTVTFSSLSPIAFAVGSEEAAAMTGEDVAADPVSAEGAIAPVAATVSTAEEPAGMSSYEMLLWGGLGAAVIIAAGAVVLLVVKKK